VHGIRLRTTVMDLDKSKPRDEDVEALVEENKR
jgi:hypothetical protein